MGGGVGLNLTVANFVILVDPWWNPAVEDQAIDRVHRIGQTRPVHVHRLICVDSVEEKLLLLQEKKRHISTQALGTTAGSNREGTNGAEGNRLTLDDLRGFFA